MDVNIMEIVRGIPPVTRIYVGATLGFSGLVYCDLITSDPSQWGLSFTKVFKYKQPYRLITSFLCAEEYNLTFLFQILRTQWVLAILEQNHSSSGDFLWYMIVLLNAVYLYTYLTGLTGDSALITSSFRDAITYIYLRKFPEMDIMVNNLVVVKAKHIYLLILFCTTVFVFQPEKYPVKSTCSGLFTGHIFFVLDELVPHVFRDINVTLPPWKWTPVKRFLAPILQMARGHGLIKDDDQAQQLLLEEVAESLAAVHEELPLLRDDDNDNDENQD